VQLCVKCARAQRTTEPELPPAQRVGRENDERAEPRKKQERCDTVAGEKALVQTELCDVEVSARIGKF